MIKNENELKSIPNEKYQKFFDKFKEIETLSVDQWKSPHLLSYFCKKYKETYNVDYAWKFNHQMPSKCFEVWQLNTLCAKLSARPQILKEYIDWAFQELVPKSKRRFTSISFLTKDEVVNPYKMNILLGNNKNYKINRSTVLSQEYLNILNEESVNINTYGDLAFLLQMNPLPANVSLALDKMVEKGFDKDILNKIV